MPTPAPATLTLKPRRHAAEVASNIEDIFSAQKLRYRVFFDVHIESRRIPCPTAGLTVANHISWIDILALATQRDFVFIAKSEVNSWPLMGSMFQGIGTLFVHRGDSTSSARMSATMEALLREGVPLLLFPEATTTNGSTVRLFSGQLFDPAVRSACRVQPVAIRYEGPASCVAPFIGDDTFLAHLLRIVQLSEIRLVLIFGSEIESDDQTKESLARRSHSTVLSLLHPN